MKAILIAEKLVHSDSLLERQFDRSLISLSLVEDFEKAQAIFIKPNLTYPDFKKGVTTRKEFVESLIISLRKINSCTRIYIGEGEGGYNSFSMTKAMHSMGFYDLERKYPNVHIVNLSELPAREIVLKINGGPYSIKLPELFFEEIDFSITCPLPKVHCMTTITLSLKNQWGCLPDTMRLKNHYVFDEVIWQICDRLKFRYAFLDGKYGLDKNGPMLGELVEVGWFVASNSLGAFDMIVSEMMGFDWKKVKHLKMAKKYGYIPRRKNIEVIGNIESLKKKFVLKRNFWNYPGLFAFKFKILTQFFYLSRYSNFLHNIMYVFRKKPLDKYGL